MGLQQLLPHPKSGLGTPALRQSPRDKEGNKYAGTTPSGNAIPLGESPAENLWGMVGWVQLPLYHLRDANGEKWARESVQKY